ncbi:MAG: hypothetical protein OCD01_17340 [Fibrobacterales bacterium]
MKSLFSLLLIAGIAFTFLNCAETTPDPDPEKKSIEDWCEAEETGALFKTAEVANVSSSATDGESSAAALAECSDKVTEEDYKDTYADMCTDGTCADQE